MKIQAKKYERSFNLLRMRGLNEALLRTNVDVQQSDLTACQHPNAKPIMPPRQRNDLKRTMEDPSGHFTHALGSLRDPDLTQALAFEFFCRCMNRSLASPNDYPMPLWHAVTSGRFDQLRDNEQYQQQVGRAGALVLSGITADATTDKLEKVRDLLERHASVPRVLIINGADPLAFCYDKLYFRPTRVTFTNRSRARADQDFG